MLGVLMCYLMLQMVLLEGLWHNKAKDKSRERSHSAPETKSALSKKAC